MTSHNLTFGLAFVGYGLAAASEWYDIEVIARSGQTVFRESEKGQWATERSRKPKPSGNRTDRSCNFTPPCKRGDFQHGRSLRENL